MYKHHILTFVDITNTGVRHKSDDPDWWVMRNQQRNYDTLIQTISLRAQPHDLTVSILDVNRESMGRSFKIWLSESFDYYKLWLMTFYTDGQDVFGPNGSLLLTDLHDVPIVCNLEETRTIFPPIFITSGEHANTFYLEPMSTISDFY